MNKTKTFKEKIKKEEAKKLIIGCLEKTDDKYDELGKALAKAVAQRLYSYTAWTKKKKLGEHHYIVEFKL
jgi:hypothetical protein